MGYCVIDFETTGFSPESCDVIEYAMLRLDEDGEPMAELTELCRPVRMGISRTITGITGITPEMVADCRSFEEALPDFLAFLGEDTLVAHNIPFDLGFLSRYCREAGVNRRFKTLCTLQLSRKRLPFLPNRKLATVAEHLGVGGEGYHRAMADVRVTAAVLRRLRMVEHK